MNRRLFLTKSAALAAGAAVFAWTKTAFAKAWPTGAFDSEEVGASMKELFGADSYAESAGITFKAPEIAENGNVVPLSVQYDGAAKGVAVFVEKNPRPLAASFELGSKAATNVGMRIKMDESSMVHAVVQTAEGKLIGTAKEVKVTIGGCGG